MAELNTFYKFSTPTVNYKLLYSQEKSYEMFRLLQLPVSKVPTLNLTYFPKLCTALSSSSLIMDQ
jgi:hypothetical protein